MFRDIRRRGFLASIGAAIAARFIPDVLVYEPESAVIPSGHEAVTLETITRAIQLEFEKEYRRIAGSSIAFDTVSRLGDSVGTEIRQVPMASHLCVGLEPIHVGDNQDFRERYILPVAHLLAHSCKDKGINVFGALQLPAGGAQAARSTSRYSSIRGVSQRDICTDRVLTRFDVIGGHIDGPLSQPKPISRRFFLAPQSTLIRGAA